jgi:hypothetical protein
VVHLRSRDSKGRHLLRKCKFLGNSLELHGWTRKLKQQTLNYVHNTAEVGRLKRRDSCGGSDVPRICSAIIRTKFRYQYLLRPMVWRPEFSAILGVWLTLIVVVRLWCHLWIICEFNCGKHNHFRDKFSVSYHEISYFIKFMFIPCRFTRKLL